MSKVNVDEKPRSLPVPATADLDAWSREIWTNGIQINELRELDHFSVQTMHHVYEITVIDPKTAEILIRGGDFFPKPRLAHVSGASFGGSCIKLQGIYVGFQLEVVFEGKRVATSRVRSIHRIQDDAPAES
jgi:hypothetical protein